MKGVGMLVGNFELKGARNKWAQEKTRAREEDTRGERELPLASHVSLARARSFLRPFISWRLLRRLGLLQHKQTTNASFCSTLRVLEG